MRQVLIYIASAVLAPVVHVVKSVILLVVPMPLIGRRSGIVTHAALSFLLNVGLVYVIVLLSRALGVEPVLYMLIPAVFYTLFISGARRIRFRSGASLEESLHSKIVTFQGGRSGSDYRELLIRREYINEISALLGFLLGALLNLEL